MKIPDDYKTFADLEEKLQKYREWDFRNRKKNELKTLYYKGIYSGRDYDNPEECDIIGYYDNTQLLIELKESKQKVVIDKRYLKEMQDKNFRRNQPAEADPNDDNSYVVFDLETTGLSVYQDEIIEIAALKVSHGEIIDTFETLVNPHFDLPKKVTKITGINDLMLSSAPDIQDVIFDFKEFVGDFTVVGHNIKSFDLIFIQRAYRKCEADSFRNKIVDTLTISRKLYPDLSQHKLINLAEYLDIEQTIGFHRALADCEYTYKCYEIMKSDLINKKPRKKKASKSDSTSKPKTSFNPYPKHADLRNLTTDKTEFDESNPFFGKYCVFTGELNKYSREEAAQIILDLGGQCENNVTRKTDYLIVSADSDPNKKSGKQKKAEEYKAKGQGIEIISESAFYDMINDNRTV